MSINVYFWIDNTYILHHCVVHKHIGIAYLFVWSFTHINQKSKEKIEWTIILTATMTTTTTTIMVTFRKKKIYYIAESIHTHTYTIFVLNYIDIYVYCICAFMAMPNTHE